MNRLGQFFEIGNLFIVPDLVYIVVPLMLMMQPTELAEYFRISPSIAYKFRQDNHAD